MTGKMIALGQLDITTAVQLLTKRTLAFLRSAPPAVRTTSVILAELDGIVERLLAERRFAQPSFGRDVLQNAVSADEAPSNQLVGVGFLEAVSAALELQRFNKHLPINARAFLWDMYEVQVAADDDECEPWHGLLSADMPCRTLTVTPKGVEALRLRGRIELPRYRKLTLVSTGHRS